MQSVLLVRSLRYKHLSSNDHVHSCRKNVCTSNVVPIPSDVTHHHQLL